MPDSTLCIKEIKLLKQEDESAKCRLSQRCADIVFSSDLARRCYSQNFIFFKVQYHYSVLIDKMYVSIEFIVLAKG